VTPEERAATERGLLDASVFVAQETGRSRATLPAMAAVSVVTLAELHLGVLLTEDPRVRAQRLQTLSSVEALFESLPVDAAVARNFAEIVAEARRQGRRPKIMDTWIAATAVTHRLPVYTQDEDFLTIPRVHVIQV
jgi:predicted nucleic acid-binding protein